MGTQKSASALASSYGLMLAVAALVHAPSAGAADNNWGGSLGVTTDYLYRGLSQTRGTPAVQGGLHMRLPEGWVAGVWSSSVDFNPGKGASVEIDLHAGKLWTLGQDWSAKLGATHYMYPNDGWRRSYDYDELSASLSYQSRLVASATWSPNTSRYSNGAFVWNRHATSYELSMLQPVSRSWSVGAGLGYYDLTDLLGTGYWYWNAGLTYAIGNLQVDLSHINTDRTATRLFGYEVAGSNWSGAVTWRF